MKRLILAFLFCCFCQSLSACEFDGVVFHSDFSTARLNDCKQLNETSYLLTIEPENFPINDSPWYAFQVTSSKAKNIRVSIEFKQGSHRYLPKVSSDGRNWRGISYKVRNDKLVFRLDVDRQPLWVAGQEIVTNEFYQSWSKALAKSPSIEMSELARSTEDRPIYQLSSRSKTNEWVIVLGRMHPPEITGALALFPFSETLLLDQKIGNAFRQRFNLLIVPNLNPDGVEHGHWRHNINGVDLNRDWVKLQQKESGSVHQALQDIVKQGGKIVFAVDFHSTRKDVFYTMPSDYGAKPAQLVNQWLKMLDQQTPDFAVEIKPGSSPGRGVFKQYVADTYGVHAVTYEMGDNTDRKQIKQVAKQAAETLMQILLDTPKSDF